MQAVDYFLVAEIPGQEFHNYSYVLPLIEPSDIEHARDLIEFGPGIGDTIVVAAIAEGTDGINRDYRAQGFPEWSWHVEEFTGFAFATMEILDGNPQLVEDDVDGWMQNTNGYIGFWGYTVVEEITPIPEPGTIMMMLLAIVLPFRLRYQGKR